MQKVSLLLNCILSACVLILLRQNAQGCNPFVATREGRQEALVEAPEQAGQEEPLAPVVKAALATTKASQGLQSSKPKKPKLRVAYARFPKTGSRYAIQQLSKVIPQEHFFVVPEALALRDRTSFTVGSVRNPCTAYLSLWAFQSDPKRRHGLMADLKRRRPDAFTRLIGKDVASNFTSKQDVQRFRQWLRYMAHPSVKIGLLSGRFHGKYISQDPKINIRDNALLVQGLTKPAAEKIQSDLGAMDPESLVDCWLHTETMDQDLKICMERFKGQGGQVNAELQEAPAFGASHHGQCSLFFDADTEALVKRLDGPLFSKFGYDSCCQNPTPAPSQGLATLPPSTLPPSTRSSPPAAVPGAKTPSSEGSEGSGSSDESSVGDPWSWGDPFLTAAGRPEAGPKSPSAPWGAQVGPCEREVSGPSERDLGTGQMLTLPPIRRALDKSILECLKGKEPKELRLQGESAQVAMYQCVLSGLPLSCGYLAQHVNFSLQEPYRREQIREIMKRYGRFSRSGLSIFKLTGFTGGKWTHAENKNLAQLVLWIGMEELAAVMLPKQDQVIDARQRTVADYVRFPGSPLYRWRASAALAEPTKNTKFRVARPPPSEELDCDGQQLEANWLGWSQASSWEHYHACDFEVLDLLDHETFEHDFLDLGRPVLLRNFAAKEDRCNMRREKVVKAHGTEQWKLGPIAYPNLVGVLPCEKTFTVEEAELGAKCLRHGNISNYHASHSPGIMTLDLAQSQTFAKVKELVPKIARLSKQYFWGGDYSGAALHYHVAAFNALFVGEKEWYVTPPYLAARSGIATSELFNRPGINEQHVFRCTQYAGDLVLLPDGWGHATLNHGFGMGIGVLYDTW